MDSAYALDPNNPAVLVGGGVSVLKQSCFVEQPTGLFKSCGTARGHPSADKDYW